MKNEVKLLERAYLEIGNVCNLDCSFCVKCKREKRIMTKDEADIALGRLSGMVKFVYLHVLGEPLLHPELDDILSLVKKHRLKACITTNGTLLDKRSEVLLKNADTIHKVSISLHAPEANAAFSADGYLNSCIAFAKAAYASAVITIPAPPDS